MSPDTDHGNGHRAITHETAASSTALPKVSPATFRSVWTTSFAHPATSTSAEGPEAIELLMQEIFGGVRQRIDLDEVEGRPIGGGRQSE